MEFNMNDKKKNNLLYFADDEIVTGKTENKKVFVTKRINGKETHTKQEIPKETEYKRVENTQGFNFEREIVIGVNNKRNTKNNKSFNIPNKATSNIESSKKTKNRYNEYQKKSNKKSKNIKNKSNNKQKMEKQNENIGKQQKNRKKGINKVVITAISLIIMTISLAIMAFVTPIFNIKEIKVEGNDIVTTANIINLSRLKIEQNIFKNNKKEIENNIKENPYIENVTVKRILPGTINLKVTERKVEYQIKLISSYIYIDSSGNILENASSKANVLFIDGYSTTEEHLINEKKLYLTDIEKLKKVSKIKEALKSIDDLDEAEISVNIKDENEFIIYIKSENKKIYIGDITNLANKMLYVSKILEKEKDHSGIIFINGDLNSGFKPYFRETEIQE